MNPLNFLPANLSQRFLYQCGLLLLKILGSLPQPLYHLIVKIGGVSLDRSKGRVARAALTLAFPETDNTTINTIAKAAAYNNIGSMLSLSRLNKISYKLHDLDIVTKALEQQRGVIIVSLHMGPPDIGTLALCKQGMPVSAMIGEAKNRRWLNKVAIKLLNSVGVPFIQRGSPIDFLKILRKKEIVVLHGDMRSKEAPVTFFGEQTTAPVSAIHTALMLNSSLLFHYCTLQENTWQLYFESFDLIQGVDKNETLTLSLQALIHKMEHVIKENQEQWIWHYDRFKLKKKLARQKSIL